MKKAYALTLIVALLLAMFACGTPAAIPNPPLILGEKFLADLDYEQALLQFDQAITIEPKNPRGYLGKADALLHLDRQTDAAQALADGAKATRRETRTALIEAKAAVETSPVNGYIGLSSAYNRLGWREIALALLKRVCEELPMESRLREALEELLEDTDSETISDQQKNKIGEVPEEITENLFTVKDFEALGVLKDSILDIYAVAERCGYSRNEVDAATTDGEIFRFDLTDDEIYANYKLSLDYRDHWVHVGVGDNFSGFAFPRNIKIGMSLNEVLDRFECPAEKKAEIIQMSPVDMQDYESNPEKYKARIYDVHGNGNGMSAEYRIALSTWFKGGGSVPYGYLEYAYTTDSSTYYYTFEFHPYENTVRRITLVSQVFD